MRIAKFLVSMSVFTLFVTMYVYQQSAIFRLGYLIDRKQARFQDLLDKNALLRYNVQKDASLVRIGDKFSKRADFQMPDTYRLVKLEMVADNTKLIAEAPKKENIFARIFGAQRQAEAKTISR